MSEFYVILSLLMVFQFDESQGWISTTPKESMSNSDVEVLLYDLLEGVNSLETHILGRISTKDLDFELLQTLKHPVKSFDIIEDATELGSGLLHLHEKDSTNSNYFDIGHKYLGIASISLQELVDDREIRRENDSLKKLIIELSRYNYAIAFPLTDWDKILFHLSNGNFDYLWDKLSNTRRGQRVLLISIISVLLISFLIIKKNR